MATRNPENVETTAKKAVSNVTHLADALPDSVKKAAVEAAHQVSDVASQAIESARENAGDYIEQAGKLIRKNPVAAIATGFGLGLLLGALIKRD